MLLPLGPNRANKPPLNTKKTHTHTQNKKETKEAVTRGIFQLRISNSAS